MLVWLHDPVNKALAICRHEARAARYASRALDQDVSRNEIKDLASLGDQLTARAERIPIPTAGDKGGGRSRGFRTIVLFRRGELAFLVYGIAKSGRENLRRDELATFRRLADEYLALEPLSLPAAQAAALGLAEAGLMSKQTMRGFDEMCLTPVAEMAQEGIRALRLREIASRAVFARYVNVTTRLVSQWERGDDRPCGASLKLLTLVAKNGQGMVA